MIVYMRSGRVVRSGSGRMFAKSAGGGGLPAWLSGVAVNESKSISNTRWDTLLITGRGAPYNFSGGCSDARRLYLFGGGRADCNDNSVSHLDFLDDAPAWARDWGPSSTGQIIDGQNFWSDGAPCSHHTYGLNVYSQFDGKIHTLGGAGPVDQSAHVNMHAVFDFALAQAAQFPWTTLAAPGDGYVNSSAVEDANGNMYIANGLSPTGMRKWTQSSNTWADYGALGVFDGYACLLADRGNNRGLLMPTPNAGGALKPMTEIDFATDTFTTVTVSGATISNGQWTGCYDTANGWYWAMPWGDSSAALYKLVRNSSSSYTATQVTPTGAGNANTTYADGNTPQPLNRFVAINSGAVKGIAFTREYNENCWFMRTAA